LEFPRNAAGNIHYNTVDGEGRIVTSDVTPQPAAIKVNGETRRVRAEITIHQLLSELDLPPDRVAVELDKRIVSKRNWATTRLASGAQLEIVQFVGGG
jgi:sulfur carrier protein